MNFIFWKKSKRTKKEKPAADLLLPKDKKEIEKLAEMKSKHLESVEELNRKITTIESSTETLVPKFGRLHHLLREKIGWYRNWHTKPYTHSVHWLVLLLYIISLPIAYFYLSPYASRTKAITYDFPRWEQVNPTPTGNDLLKTAACSQDGSAWTVGDVGTIFRSSATEDNWVRQYTNTDKDLKDIICIDPSNIIAVGAYGDIVQYNGITWTTKASGTTSNLFNLVALDSTHIIAIGNSGAITVSTDAGQTWEVKTSSTTDNLRNAVAFDATHTLALGVSGRILISNDAGQTWEVKTSSTSENLRGAAILDSTHAIAVGDNGAITVSTDIGQTWTAKTSGDGNHFNSVVALDSTHAIAVNFFGGIATSSDAGQTWTLKTSGTGDHLMSVTALDSTHAITVGDHGTVSISSDAGQTWTLKTSGTTSLLRNVATISSTRAIAVGDFGGTTVSSNAGQTWVTKTSGTVEEFYDVITLDSTHAIAVGVGGSIFLSSDAGQTWTAKTSGVSAHLTSVTTFDSTHLVAVGFPGGSKTITVSSDAGQTWTAKETGTTILDDVAALSSVRAIAVGMTNDGRSGAVMTTADAGQTWTTRTSGATQTLKEVVALDSTHAIAVGNSGTIIVSTNAGQTWTTKASGTTLTLQKVVALDSTHAIVIGSSGTIIVSSDAGQTWTTKASDTTNHLNGITVLDSTHAIAAGANGTITVSADAGQTWTTKASDTTNHLFDINSFNGNYVIAVGDLGGITVSSDAGQTWTSKGSGTINLLRTASIFDATHSTAVGDFGTILRYYSPANATATKLLIKLPGQSFADGVGVSGTPNAVQAGDQVTATIYAVDANNNLDKGNASYASFTTTDPNDSNPATIQLTQDGTCVQTNRQPGDPECGIGTATFQFHTAGTWTINTNDAYGVLSSITSSSVTINPGDPAKLVVSGLPSSLNAGAVSGAVTVKITDTYGNETTTGSSTTINLSTTSSNGKFAQSSSGPWSEESKNITISAGSSSATFYYYDLNVGTPTITASETPSAGWEDDSDILTINTGAISQSSLTVDKNSLAAGESLTATVTLKNNEGTVLPSKSVQLFSSRNTSETTTDSISPSSATTDSNGVASFTVSSTSIGDFILSAYDQSDNLYVAQEQGVSVSIGNLGKIVVESSASEVQPGSPFEVTATTYDSYNNVKTDFTGTLEFSSSDSSVKFVEASHALTSSEKGKYTQSIILQGEGEQSVQVTADGISGIAYVTVTPSATPAAITSPTPSATTSTIITTPSPTETTAKPLSAIEALQESPTLQKIAQALTPVTATVATLGIVPLLVQAFPQGFQALASLFPAIFTAAAVRRRRKPWGIVYDSITGKPVDLAVVRVFNESNDKLVATKVTDQNGRFNFLLARGKYYVTVTKAGYIFPPKISKLKAYQLSTRFGPQSDIYFGQPFVIGADDTNVNLNIGLDHKTRNLSLANKTIIWVKNGLDWFLIGLSYFAVPLMILGAIFASLAVVVAPSTFHLVLSGFYVLLLIAYLIGSRIQAARIGTVFDSISKKPIAKATVSIFDKEYNAIREIKTTDQNGRFAILAQRGQYYLTVQAKGYKFPSKEFSYQKKDKKLGHIYLGETINNKKPGFVSVHIPLDKEEKK